MVRKGRVSPGRRLKIIKTKVGAGVGTRHSAAEEVGRYDFFGRKLAACF